MPSPWYLLVLVVPFAAVVFLAVKSIRSRRPDNLGVKAGKLAPCPRKPNCVCTQAEDAGHRIEPIHFTGSVAKRTTRLKQAIATLPRSIIVTETEDYLHVECTSLLFRFVDDVEFWIDGASGTIHFHSASRAGHSDFGVNRARMEAVRRAF